MWELETIVKLNEKAEELARQGSPEREALVAVGISYPDFEAKRCDAPKPGIRIVAVA